MSRPTTRDACGKSACYTGPVNTGNHWKEREERVNDDQGSNAGTGTRVEDRAAEAAFVLACAHTILHPGSRHAPQWGELVAACGEALESAHVAGGAVTVFPTAFTGPSSAENDSSSGGEEAVAGFWAHEDYDAGPFHHFLDELAGSSSAAVSGLAEEMRSASVNRGVEENGSAPVCLRYGAHTSEYTSVYEALRASGAEDTIQEDWAPSRVRDFVAVVSGLGEVAFRNKREADEAYEAYEDEPLEKSVGERVCVSSAGECVSTTLAADRQCGDGILPVVVAGVGEGVFRPWWRVYHRLEEHRNRMAVIAAVMDSTRKVKGPGALQDEGSALMAATVAVEASVAYPLDRARSDALMADLTEEEEAEWERAYSNGTAAGRMARGLMAEPLAGLDERTVLAVGLDAVLGPDWAANRMMEALTASLEEALRNRTTEDGRRRIAVVERFHIEKDLAGVRWNEHSLNAAALVQPDGGVEIVDFAHKEDGKSIGEAVEWILDSGASAGVRGGADSSASVETGYGASDGEIACGVAEDEAAQQERPSAHVSIEPLALPLFILSSDLHNTTWGLFRREVARALELAGLEGANPALLLPESLIIPEDHWEKFDPVVVAGPDDDKTRAFGGALARSQDAGVAAVGRILEDAPREWDGDRAWYYSDKEYECRTKPLGFYAATAERVGLPVLLEDDWDAQQSESYLDCVLEVGDAYGRATRWRLKHSLSSVADADRENDGMLLRVMAEYVEQDTGFPSIFNEDTDGLPVISGHVLTAIGTSRKHYGDDVRAAALAAFVAGAALEARIGSLHWKDISMEEYAERYVATALDPASPVAVRIPERAHEVSAGAELDRIRLAVDCSFARERRAHVEAPTVVGVAEDDFGTRMMYHYVCYKLDPGETLIAQGVFEGPTRVSAGARRGE